MEIKPEHRSALLALAAQRGEKGFSRILEEAIEHYLTGEAEREKRREMFLSLAGTLTEEDADDLRREVERIRANWR